MVKSIAWHFLFVKAVLTWLPLDKLRPRARRGELVISCGSLVLKSIKRSVINIRRSMLNVRCSTLNLIAVQSMLGDLCSKSDRKVFSDECKEAYALTPDTCHLKPKLTFDKGIVAISATTKR